MAERQLEVVISKQSEIELKKAIEIIDQTNSAVKGLKIAQKTVNGVPVSVLRILIDV